MGMFDTFHYVCPFCNKDTSVQTKLGECVLRSLSIGYEFPINGIIQMKNPCEHCEEYSSVVAEDNIIIRFTKDAANKKEGLWGEINDEIQKGDVA